MDSFLSLRRQSHQIGRQASFDGPGTGVTLPIVAQAAGEGGDEGTAQFSGKIGEEIGGQGVRRPPVAARWSWQRSCA
jgi:hypothetical protein